MSVSAMIAPHIPYLRRYARALAGNQTSGDAYVIATLETLVSDHSAFEQDLPPRLALYKVFSRIWNSVSLNGSNEGLGSLAPVDRRLEAITPLPRQAFLLTAVEGFAPDDAAAILGTDRPQVDRLLDEAGRQIGQQMMTSVLIIEDEPIIAMDLEALVLSLGHEVIGIARTRTEAAGLVAERRPGLVLADIQLADGSSGLDAVNEMLANFAVPVVFITAYPERLLTGERPEPAFLITKPFREDMVKAVISQALFFDTKPDTRQSGNAMQAQV